MSGTPASTDAGGVVDAGELRCRFWGVRGSTPAPSPRHAVYGGNTPCLEVRAPDGGLVIFDAGTGIRELGLQLCREEQLNPHIFLTHFHWDHIQGLPFFAPLYEPDCLARFYSVTDPVTLQNLLRGQMSVPYFPFPYDVLPGRQDCERLTADPFAIGQLTVQPFELTHPQGCTGYRISAGGKVIVYATDHEHGRADVDRNLREVCSGADVLIYDAQYTPAEYPTRFGWGHSTWQEGVNIARDAGVRELVLFHHDPMRDDAAVEEIEGCARRQFPCTSAAREGQWV